MRFNWLRRWLRSEKAVKHSVRKAASTRLVVQQLEDRLVPAILTVNASTDNNSSDAGLTLREAVLLVNAGGNASLALGRTLSGGESAQINGAFGASDTIHFNKALASQTIKLALNEMPLAKSITIDGEGVPNLAIDANGTSRIFNIDDGLSTQCVVNIGNLTLTGGNIGTGGDGGAIHNAENLTITGVYFTSNFADNDGGALYTATAGSTVISGSTFFDNQANNRGGAVFGQGGTLSIVNSTVSTNSATNSGGGVMVNNTATTIIATTIVLNQVTTAAGTGGGLTNIGPATTTLRNSIVAGNFVNTPATPQDLDSTVSNALGAGSGNNLIGDPNSANGLAEGVNGNRVGVGGGNNSLLSVDLILNANLAFYGGPTPMHALVAGSRALDAGNNTFVAGIGSDQRGSPFSRIANGAVDIGAIEMQSLSLLVDNKASDSDDGIYSAGNLTLREAINLANANPRADSISFAASLANQTITLGGTELPVTDSVTVTGLGANNLTISANNTSRVFNIDDAIDNNNLSVAISGITLTRGRSNASLAESGGGVLLNLEKLTLDAVEITNGTTTNTHGGGIWNDGNLSITRSTLAGNNSALDGGAIFNGGTLTITDSTLSGNRSARDGSAIENAGSGDVTIVNSSVVGNRADADGDDVGAGALDDFGSRFVIQNTIVAGNQRSNATTPSDINNGVTGNNNLIGDADSSGNFSNGVNGTIVGNSGVGVLPLASILDANLAYNGGATRTHALVPGSLALNAGSNAAANNASLSTDQRGAPRIFASIVDIGAVEEQATTPVVLSIVRSDSDPTNGATVRYNITFSENVTAVDVNDFTLTTTGLTGASVSNVSGNGSTRTVTVNTGAGTGTLRLNLSDNDSIINAGNISLGGAGIGNGNFTGEAYNIDKSPLVVLSIVRASAQPTNAALVNYTVTYSESVSGVDVDDFALVTSGLSSSSIANVTGNGSIYTVAVNTGAGCGTLRLDAGDNDTVQDSAGNRLGGAGLGNGNFTTGESYAIDKTAPVVQSVVRASAQSTSAAQVSYNVTFSESVTGVDINDFALATTGLSGASIGNVTGNGSIYTVNVNTGTGNGTLRLNVNDNDSVQDTVGNPLGGAGLNNGNFTTGEVYTVDKNAPVVLSIVRASAPTTNAAQASYNITFSEIVSGVDVNDFALTASGLSGASVANVTGNGSIYTVTVNTGTGCGTLRLDAIDNDSISDSAGNRLGGTGIGNGNFTTGEVYNIDNVVPVVQSIVRASAQPTNAAQVNYTVTFSESVIGVDVNDFILNSTGLTGASIANVSGNGSIYAVAINTGAGCGTLRLDANDNDTVQDGAGNRLGGTGLGNGNFTTGEVYNIDKTSPAVTSITTTAANGTYGIGSSIIVAVQFSENITVTGAPSLTLETGASDAVLNLAGNGTNTLTFNYTVSAGQNSSDLDYVSASALALNGGTIRDALGNNANLTLPAPGAAGSFGANKNIVIDTAAPTLVSFDDGDADNSVSINTTLNYSVTFNEDIDDASVTAADFNNAGNASISIGNITETSPGVFSVQVTPTSAGTLVLRIPAGAVVSDFANNNLAVPVQDNDIVNVVANLPPVNSLPTSQTVTPGASLLFSRANGNALTVNDPDGGSGTVKLQASKGSLAIAINYGVTLAGTNTANLTLTGTFANINKTLDTLFFQAPSNTGAANITIATTDDAAGSDADVLTVNVVASKVNAAPTLIAPLASQNVALNVPLAFSEANNNSIQVGDIDSGYGKAQLNLKVNSGTLSLNSAVGLHFIGIGTNNVTLIGRIDHLNYNLRTLTYTPDSSFPGSDTLAITLNDQGNTGSGGAKSVVRTVSFVGPAGPKNQPPVNIVPAGTQTIVRGAAYGFSRGNQNAIQIADPDAGNGVLTVNLKTNVGTLTFSANYGVTVTGYRSASMSLSGTVADLNRTLDTLYLVVSQATGNIAPIGGSTVPVIVVTTTDNGYSGSGGVKTDVDIIQLALINGPVANVSPLLTVPNFPQVGATVNFSDLNNNALRVGDRDAGFNNVKVTLQVNAGKLKLTNLVGCTVVGNNTATLTIIGRIDYMNFNLQSLIYSMNAGFIQDTLSVRIDDLGNAGTGGNRFSTAVVNLSRT